MRTTSFFLSIALFLSLKLPTLAVVRDTNAASEPVSFSDGSVATAYDHCGDADLCATVAYPNGEKLLMYSEGAAYCQPYIIQMLKTSGPQTVYEFSRTLNHDVPKTSAFGTCGNNQATQMTLDRGMVHLSSLQRRSAANKSPE